VLPDLVATCARGAEDVCAAELRALGAKHVKQDRGAVRFVARLETAREACLWLRTAMRVLWRVAEFPAPDAQALYEGAAAVAWKDHLTPRHTFAVEATGRSEALTHSGFIALKVKDAIADAMRRAAGARPDVDPKDPDVRVVAHLAQGRCALHLDLAGEPLFKRGYRQQGVEAPLKETLAAAILLWAGYDGTKPFLDPMCGSGTFPIEAALISCGRAPGLVRRRFGFERWPSFGDDARRAWEQARVQARERARDPRAIIAGADSDPAALEAATRNAAAAGLSRAVHFRLGDARELEPLAPPGFIAMNPPYGERLKPGDLASLYRALGERARALRGHHIVVLAGNAQFEPAFGLAVAARRKLFNGPLACEALRYEP
jgi:putative N6-adenine-specific DNA methylase